MNTTVLQSDQGPGAHGQGLGWTSDNRGYIAAVLSVSQSSRPGLLLLISSSNIDHLNTNGCWYEATTMFLGQWSLTVRYIPKLYNFLLLLLLPLIWGRIDPWQQHLAVMDRENITDAGHVVVVVANISVLCWSAGLVHIAMNIFLSLQRWTNTIRTKTQHSVVFKQSCNSLCRQFIKH